MKIAAVLLAVAAAFAGGYYIRSTCESDSGGGTSAATPAEEGSAGEALTELLRYTGQGSHAGRRVVELVDRVVAGGPAMLPALERALKDSPAWSYGLVHSIDHRNGVFSILPSRRVATLEAVARIGGAKAVELLIYAAEDERMKDRIELLAPLVFLGRHADDSRVREFFTARAKKWLRVMRKDSLVSEFLKVARGRLDPEIEPNLSGALALGWPQAGVAETIAHCLYEIDAGRARAALFGILLDPQKAMPGRKTVAWALGRMPEARPDALARILNELGDAELLQRFLTGIGKARFDEADRYYAAVGSDAPDAFRDYVEDRKRDIDACRGLLDAVEQKVGMPAAAKYGIPALRDNFNRVLGDYAKKQQLIEAAKKQPE